MASPTLRVLFVIPGESQGSSMVFARRQAESLIANGVEVELFHLRSRTSLRTLVSEARRFRSIFSYIRPNIVHAHFGTMTALFTVIMTRGIPVVITYRGSDLNAVPSSSGPRATIGRFLSQIAALGAARIVCVSSHLRKRLWWRQDRACVLPSGVDTDVFERMPRAEARKCLGWDENVPVLLFNAGHDARNKRLDLAKAAFALVHRDLPKARMEVLCGDKPPGMMPAILNASDCLLITSDAEGSPTIVQEAMATNLPIVSVDVGDVAARLQGVEQCSIVSRDPAALARAIVHTLRSGLRSNGRHRAREFTATHIAEELLRLYRSVAVSAVGKDLAWTTTRF